MSEHQLGQKDQNIYPVCNGQVDIHGSPQCKLSLPLDEVLVVRVDELSPDQLLQSVNNALLALSDAMTLERNRRNPQG